jgi:MFS family permease
VIGSVFRGIRRPSYRGRSPSLGGPIVGGLLLAHFWWGSVFLLNIPLAVLGIIAAVLIIPETRGPAGRTSWAPCCPRSA